MKYRERERAKLAAKKPIARSPHTMLSHRRDQIVKDGTSIFRVTPPAVVQFLGNILRYICHCAHDRVLSVLDTETSPLLSRSYPLSLSWFRWSSFLGRRREDDTLSRRDSTEYKSRRSRIYLLCTELLIYSSRWPRKQIQIMIKISLRFHEDHDFKFLLSYGKEFVYLFV